MDMPSGIIEADCFFCLPPLFGVTFPEFTPNTFGAKKSKETKIDLKRLDLKPHG